MGKRSYASWDGPLGRQAADITLIEGANSGFGALGIIVTAESKPYLQSAFPVASKGVVHRVRVADIHNPALDLSIAGFAWKT